jgi:hypothetical protein
MLSTPLVVEVLILNTVAGILPKLTFKLLKLAVKFAPIILTVSPATPVSGEKLIKWGAPLPVGSTPPPGELDGLALSFVHMEKTIGAQSIRIKGTCLIFIESLIKVKLAARYL